MRRMSTLLRSKGFFAAPLFLTRQWQRYEVNEATQTTYSLTKNHTEEKPQGVVTSMPIKIFFQNDSYKTLFVEPEWTVRVLLDRVVEKLGMDGAGKHFQLLEHVKVGRRPMGSLFV